jgi:hypothetical protein
MHKITNATELRNAIQQLEHKQAHDWPILKTQLLDTYENLKLINILKSTFKNAIATPGLKEDLLNTGIGITTGVIAKKLVIGKTHNPIKKLFGLFLEMAVANSVAKNTNGIKSIGSLILKKYSVRRLKRK